MNEVQDFLTLTNHLVGFGLIMVNQCFLDSLSQGNENKVKHEIRKASQFGTNKMNTSEASILAALQNHPTDPMIVVTPNAAAIRAAAEPAINNLFATKWTVTTWAEVLAQ